MFAPRRGGATRALSEIELKLIGRALADPRRFNILRQIGGCTGSATCYEILSTHAISAATLSHHMKELEAAGLVASVKEGKSVYYTLQRDVLQSYIKTLNDISRD